MSDIGFYRSPLELDKELCHLLGVITARWSMVELALQHFFSEMLQNEDTATAIFYSTGSVRQRIELLRATADTTFTWTDDFESFSKLLSKVYDAFKKRNRLVHSSYQAVFTPSEGEIQKLPSVSPSDSEYLKKGKLHHIGYEQPFGDPKPVNKGTFLNHLDRLDALLCELVFDYMDNYDGLTGDDPKWRDKLPKPPQDS